MKNVLVTNGTASLAVLEEIFPLTDAMNIDLEGFRNRITGILAGIWKPSWNLSGVRRRSVMWSLQR